MKFLLTSAGLKNTKLANALEELVGKPLLETSLVFVGTAANLGTDDKGWIIGNLVQFQKRGLKSVDITDIALPENIWKPHLLTADVICFGGGNEKYLARIAEEVGLMKFLRSLPETTVYMGISAGSMITGHFLAEGLIEELFPEEDYGGEMGKPMALHDFNFLPHLNSDWFKHMRKEKLEVMKEKFGLETYATDDETALKIDGEKIEVVGGGESWVYKL